jgi:serine/threonine-protein kinase
LTELTDRLQAALGSAYRLERELGGGGMSRVFVAEEVALARKVVVKVLPPEMGAGLNAERFRREIQLAASLQHPHVVPLHAAGRTDDLVWYTMPLIEGESLRAKLAREGELPVTETVKILRDVADSLAYAHTHGVVHRDIKPDNVLISGRHAVVTDFGVAKALSEATGEASLTSVGVALGTPSYMAPEQAAADPHVDHRADIYALGAMAYEMLTGRPPFSGSPQMVLAAHVTQAPEPVTARRASVPPALATLIMRCLEKKAADRYQTASELHQQLELMATPSGGMSPTSATAGVAQTMADGTPIARVRRAAPFAVGAIVLVIAALFGWKQLQTSDGAMALDPKVVAVLPFRVVGADPSLQFLRQGMMDLLHAKLTGEGGPRAADVQSVMAAVRDVVGEDADAAGEQLLSVVRRVGAGFVIQGSLVGPADKFVLSATLVEMPSGRSAAQTSVEGSKDEIFALVNELAQRLLALGAGASETQLEALTTTNFDALRAYLDGAAALRRGAYVPAMLAFERASTLDSTFALSHSMIIETAGWGPNPVMDMNRVRRLAWAYRDRLHATDQRLLSIRLGSRWPDPTPMTVTIRDREALVRALPESPIAWYYLGDAYFHSGAIAGYSEQLARARAAFEEAVRRDSSFASPIEHLATMSWFLRDTATFVPLAERRLALDSTGWGALFFKANLAFLRGSRAERQSALQALAVDGYMQFINITPLSPDVVGAADTLLALARARTRPPDQRAEALLFESQVRLTQGRPSQARALRDSAFSIGEMSPRRRLFQMVRDALFTEADTTGIGALLAQDRPEAVWRIVWALREGDLDFADQAVRELREFSGAAAESDSPPLRANRASAARLALVVDAALAQIRSQPDAARRTAIADSAVLGWRANDDYSSLVLSAVHEALGNDVAALTALERKDLLLGQPEMAAGLAYRLRTEGRLAARLGQRDRAIKAYQNYLLWRANPEPSLIPQRDSVRAELAKLTGER